MIGINAGIVVARHIKTTEDLSIRGIAHERVACRCGGSVGGGKLCGRWSFVDSAYRATFPLPPSGFNQQEALRKAANGEETRPAPSSCRVMERLA